MSSTPPPLFVCNLCKRDDRFDPSWVHHLASLGHQRALTRQPQGGSGTWGETTSVKYRAVEVVGCHELKANPIDIAEYLSKQGGPIEEFICPTSLSGTKPNIVSCLFKEAESVKKILEVEEHKIFRQPIQIRKKYECQTDNEHTANEEVLVVDGEGADQQKIEVLEDGEIANSQENGKEGGKKKKRNQKKTAPVLLPLEEQLTALSKFHNPELRAKIVKDLHKVVAVTFNNGVVYSYGPDFFGVCLDSDELRLCVDPYGKFSSKSAAKIIRNASDPMACGLTFQILSTCKDGDGSLKFAFVSQYSTSNVLDIPEISFKQTINQKHLPCKLQFENFLSVQKSRLLKFLTNHDVRVGPLFSMIRLWGKAHQVFHELREGEEFEGYILIMLMVFHLTRIKFFPSVAELRELDKKNTPRIVDNMNIGFCSNRKQVPGARVTNDKSIRALSIVSILKEFFQFFANFKFTDNVVCCSTGMVLESRAFRPQVENQLPSEILKYYRLNADGTLREKKLEIFSPVIVQDFLDLTDNVARALDDADLAYFQSQCDISVKFLDRVLKNGNGNVMKHFTPKVTGDEEDSESESSEDEEEIMVPSSTVEISPLPRSPIPLAPSPPPPTDSPTSDWEQQSPSNNEASLSPPPLRPPPAPFRIAGMPSVATSTPNIPKRSTFLPTPPPPPKIGGFLHNPNMFVNDIAPEDINFSASRRPYTRKRERETDSNPSSFELQFSSPKPIQQSDHQSFNKKRTTPGSIPREPICRILRDPRGGEESGRINQPGSSSSGWKKNKKTDDWHP
ncbi:uncharacterized protein LOC110844911 isoform X2 [Folsomia candida]|uniref:Speckle targeted PIP5K1A-regulated poly(A) polymerase n=1 Tax=Folsomia candida TaxID=158441 RepID=A0A226EMI2_FOLCA|nr:uncharacterized protein LOC110844911 isoform X2 [Folsomia candida]OXA58903.1 Speckle targeted PIP5K1A-regulated poly(A) polymerase [Folsomia candida]